MTDVERDLRDRLRRVRLPTAPPTLQRALEDVVLIPVERRRSSRRPLVLLGLAAVLAVGGAVAAGAALLNRHDTITYSDIFSPTGSMTMPRLGQTATRLQDGRVLIAGGAANDTTTLTSAELYDPSNGTFTATGSMTVARVFAAATLLNDGRVLIVGGELRQPGFFSRPTSAELYDPRTGTFSATGTMTTAREGATATPLADGRVLFAGGSSGNPALPMSSAEVYDPQTGTFSATGSMTVEREAAATARLSDGRVLVVGGYSGGELLLYAELYDPQTGTFTASGSMSAEREAPTAVVLPDGRVLVVGGRSAPAGLGGVTTAEVYAPATGTFTDTGSMAMPRVSPSAVLLRDGRVLIVGGGLVPGISELYSPATGTFGPAGMTVVPRTEASATLLLDGRVLLAGGRGTTVSDYLSSAEVFH